MENAYAQDTTQVLKYFSVSETQGLSASQVVESREKYGRNGKILFVTLCPSGALTFSSNRRRAAYSHLGTDS